MNLAPPWEFPQKGDKKSFKESTIDTGSRGLGLPPDGICNSYSGFVGYGDLHLQASEYSCTLHFKNTNSQPLFGGGAEDRIVGPQAVMGAGGFVPWGNAGRSVGM